MTKLSTHGAEHPPPDKLLFVGIEKMIHLSYKT